MDSFSLNRRTVKFLKTIFVITGLERSDRWPILLTVCIRFIWLTWLAAVVFIMFYLRLSGGDTSVGGLVGTALFVFNGTVSFVIILESIAKHHKFVQIERMQHQVDLLIMQYLGFDVKVALPKSAVTKQILLLVLLQIICECFRIWVSCRQVISPVYWHSLPQTQVIRFRYIQLIFMIMQLNQRANVVCNALEKLVIINKPKKLFTSEIWKPYAEWEYEQLNALRFIYCRIYETYEAFNDCFGWTILTMFMTSFFDIVCNAFWTFTANYELQDMYKNIFNGGTTLSLISLIAILFNCTDISKSNLHCLILSQS